MQGSMGGAKAHPAKLFFVDMLTRDIDLPDAILDLLDNCVDGIVRSIEGTESRTATPYKDYWAEICIEPSRFVIKDNCGGISREVAENYAFVMGRTDKRDENIQTVGMYGIGMKRALFKMGRYSNVRSSTSVDSFQVTITPEWLDNDSDWQLPIEPVEHTGYHGTTIVVEKINQRVADLFSMENFRSDLIKAISTHYSIIISKGFCIKINGHVVEPSETKLLLTDSPEGLAPYVYQGTINDVIVLLQVGFYRPTPSPDELDDEQIQRRSRDDAGWTIVCNDRVVVYKDKTILTGWGEHNVPSYHSQFIGITGIVVFQTNQAIKLPVTTTKRGIDASSTLYLQVKNYMRTGMKYFTDYTNRWKLDPEGERVYSAQASAYKVDELVARLPEEKWAFIQRNNNPTERQYIPTLPKPNISEVRRQVRFTRDVVEIKKVSQILFDDPDRDPSEVGNTCFDRILKGDC